MIGLDAFGTPALPTGATPPEVFITPATVEPRAVEESEQSALHDDSGALSYNSSRAVLQLVQRSAEDFAALLDAGEAPSAAAAMTGTPDTGLGRTGELIDQYA
jgi:hypothetical protein